MNKARNQDFFEKMKQVKKQENKTFWEWFISIPLVKTIREKPLPSKLLFSVQFILIALLIFLVKIFVDVINGDWYWVGVLDMGGKGETLRFIGIAMGGVLLAIQATVSYQRAKAMEDTVSQTEKGQRQERLKNAIDHLGHGGPFMRLGGAYELFHLAEDTKALRQTVLEILCAYIRRTTRSEAYQKEYEEKPSEEIQSLLTLLFVQDHKVFDGYRINLQGSCLNGASLPQARLQKANLWKAQLQGATLFRAQLRGADISDAHLQEANLFGARLQGTKLFSSRLQGAVLNHAKLQGAGLNHAQLQGAELWVAQLQGAKLNNAQLQGAYLLEVQLQGAVLNYARLQGAVLNNAQLQGAILQDAQLQGADLSEAQLQGVSSDDESQPYLFLDFADLIRQRINKESDYSTVVFSGGLSEEQVNNMMKEIPDSKSAARLEKRLKPHIGKPRSRELPTDSGADTGTYTKGDAEQWIKEYEEAFNRDDAHS